MTERESLNCSRQSSIIPRILIHSAKGGAIIRSDASQIGKRPQRIVPDGQKTVWKSY